MRGRLAAVAAAAAFVAAGGTACAMTAPDPQAARCEVLGADKLPADSGGSEALCAAIETAAAARAPGLRYRAEVRVLSSSRLAATLTADGRKLPEQNFATMDRALNRASFERFAQAIAAQLAAAAKR